jgi:hypothetical protein
MNTKRMRTFLSLVIVGIVLGWAVVGSSSAAEPPAISTTTGVVTSIEEDRAVLVIYGSMAFYPGEKIANKHRGERGPIPDWVKVGSEVSLSYYVLGGNRFYLDVVEPGQGFPVKEEVEVGRETPQ